MHSQPALKGLCGRLSGVRCIMVFKATHNRNKRSTLIPTVCCFKGQCTPFCDRIPTACWLWYDQKKNGYGGGRVLCLLCPPPTVTAAGLCCIFPYFLTAGIDCLIKGTEAHSVPLCFCAVAGPQKRTAGVRVAPAHHVLPTW